VTFERVIEGVLRDVRPVRGGVLIGVLVVLAGALGLIWGVLFRSAIVRELAVATGGLAHPTLLAATVTALLVVAVLVNSRTPLRELGLRRRDLPRALVVLVVLYGALQLAIVVAVLLSGERLAAPQSDASAALGLIIAQLFGNALVEEVVFRGFLFRQLLARARLCGGLGALVVAIAVAAGLFALWHIPLRFHQGYRGLDLIATLGVVALGGVLACYLYARSGNLLIVVVLHALFNEQVPLFVSPVPPQWILCALAIGLIAWIELSARRVTGAGRIA
jgi:uncharacterized protein